MERLTKKKNMNQQYNTNILQKLKLKYDIKFLEQYKKKGTSIIMATIPPGAGNLDKAIKLCKQKSVNSNNIKDRTNRDSVQQTTQKMVRYLDSINAKEFDNSNGLMLYVGVFGKS